MFEVSSFKTFRELKEFINARDIKKENIVNVFIGYSELI